MEDIKLLARSKTTASTVSSVFPLMFVVRRDAKEATEMKLQFTLLVSQCKPAADHALQHC